MDSTGDRTTVEPVDGPAPGTVLLGRYRVNWTIGVGGYGYVLHANRLDLDEPVALKILRDDRETDKEAVTRFIREAKAIAKLKSEHVARVHDCGMLPTGVPYLVMELLEGEDLYARLERAGPMPLRQVAEFVLQACEALAEAHAMGIIHRDIKPSNLFYVERSTFSLIKVLDFGISKATRSESDTDMKLTQTQSVLGTPAYMSPEQMRNARDVDARTDIWSLGAVMFELLEGRLPFDADNFAELCVAVATEEPGPMLLAPELQSVVNRCLAKQPEGRYADLAELALALAPFARPAVADDYVPRIHRLLGRDVPNNTETKPAVTVPVEAIAAAFDPAVTSPRSRAITIPRETTSRRRSRAGWWLAVATLLGVAAGLAILLVMQSTDDTTAAAKLPSPPELAPPPDHVAKPAVQPAEEKRDIIAKPEPAKPVVKRPVPPPPRKPSVAKSPPTHPPAPRKPVVPPPCAVDSQHGC